MWLSEVLFCILPQLDYLVQPSILSDSGCSPGIVDPMLFYLHAQPQSQAPAEQVFVDAGKVNIHQPCPQGRMEGRLLMASIQGGDIRGSPLP